MRDRRRRGASSGVFGVLDIGTTRSSASSPASRTTARPRRSASAGSARAASRAAASSTSRKPRARSAPRSARPRRWPTRGCAASSSTCPGGQPESRAAQHPVADRRPRGDRGRPARHHERGPPPRRRGRAGDGACLPARLHGRCDAGRQRSARHDLRHADRAAAPDRCGAGLAAQPRRLPDALRPRGRGTGLRAVGRRPRHAGRGREAARRHRHRHGRRHHRHRGVRRGPAAAHRAAAGRRLARHQRPGAAAVDAGRACRAAEDAAWRRARTRPTTSANAAGAAGRRGGRPDRPGPARHGGRHHPPAARGNLRAGARSGSTPPG